MGINKKIIGLAVVAMLVASGAHAGNGSGNPKNDSGYYIKEPVAYFIWKDGKLVPNPKRAEDRKDGERFNG